MNKLNKLGYFSLGAAIITGGFYYFIWQKSQKIIQNSQPIVRNTLLSDDRLIQFLQDLKCQSYPHFFLVAGIIKSLKNDVKNEQLYQQTYLKVLPEIQKLFSSKQNLVLVKYGLNMNDIALLQDNMDSSTNQKIIKLRNIYEKLYLDAINGIEPQIILQEQTRQYFTGDRLIAILNKILKTTIEIIYNIFQELRQKNGPLYKIVLQSDDFLQLLHKKDFIQTKTQILEENGIGQYELELDEDGEPKQIMEIFQKIIQFRKNEDAGFKQIMDSMETRYEQLITKFQTEDVQRSDALQLIEKINEQDI